MVHLSSQAHPKKSRYLTLIIAAFANTEEEVFIPDKATSIASYAFSSAQGIRRLRFLDDVKDKG